jgi:hypothetical protein
VGRASVGIGVGGVVALATGVKALVGGAIVTGVEKSITAPSSSRMTPAATKIAENQSDRRF